MLSPDLFEQVLPHQLVHSRDLPLFFGIEWPFFATSLTTNMHIHSERGLLRHNQNFFVLPESTT
jgi:hypothetical protein